jgi:hypothetical protein
MVAEINFMTRERGMIPHPLQLPYLRHSCALPIGCSTNRSYSGVEEKCSVYSYGLIAAARKENAREEEDGVPTSVSRDWRSEMKQKPMRSSGGGRY